MNINFQFPLFSFNFFEIHWYFKVSQQNVLLAVIPKTLFLKWVLVDSLAPSGFLMKYR